MEILRDRTDQEAMYIRETLEQVSATMSRVEKAILKELATRDLSVHDLVQVLQAQDFKNLAPAGIVDVLFRLRRKVQTFFAGSIGSFKAVRIRIVGSIGRAREDALDNFAEKTGSKRPANEPRFHLESYRLRILEGTTAEEGHQILRALSKIEFTDAERLILEEINAIPLEHIANPQPDTISPVNRIGLNLQDYGSGGKEGSVRTAISRIRSKMESFFDGPIGIFEDVRIQLLKNTRGDEAFQFKVERNLQPPGARAFWASHLRTGKPMTIVIGQPVFFEDISGFLVRDYLMDAQEGWAWARHVLRKLTPDEPANLVGEMKRVTSFAGVQDFRGMLALLRYFDGWQKNGHPRPEFFAARELEVQAIDQSNLVFLGSPFENPYIWNIECNWFDYQMEEADRLEGLADIPTMKDTWTEERAKREATWERRNAKWYGGLIRNKLTTDGGHVVSVSRKSKAGQGLTIIEALDPDALRVVCDVLTIEEDMQDVIRHFGLDMEWTGFPDCFELSFIVEPPKQPGEFAFRVHPECWGPRITHMVKNLDPNIVNGGSTPREGKKRPLFE